MGQKPISNTLADVHSYLLERPLRFHSGKTHVLSPGIWCGPFLGKSLFAFEFAKRLDLIERAVIWHELPEHFTPLEFLTWAHRYKLKVPDAFIECTFDRGEPIRYWHDLCAIYAGELKASQSELQATRDALVALQEASAEEGQRRLQNGWMHRFKSTVEWRARTAQLNSLKEDLAQVKSETPSWLNRSPRKLPKRSSMTLYPRLNAKPSHHCYRFCGRRLWLRPK